MCHLVGVRQDATVLVMALSLFIPTLGCLMAKAGARSGSQADYSQCTLRIFERQIRYASDRVFRDTDSRWRLELAGFRPPKRNDYNLASLTLEANPSLRSKYCDSKLDYRDAG